MSIIVNKENSVFNLQTPNTSYIVGIYKNKFPVNLHYGKRVEGTVRMKDMLYSERIDFSPYSELDGELVCDESLPLEYPLYGSNNLRAPAFHARYADGSRITDLDYMGYNVYRGKKHLEGLPAVYTESDSEADTLEIELKDKRTGLVVVLSYTAFNNYDAITRSVHIKNDGADDITILSAQSAHVSLVGKDYDFSHLDGTWANERNIHTTALENGNYFIDSKRGASSHMFNPFMMISSKNSTETTGDVYGFSLVYSGNFIAGVNVDSNDMCGAYIGINSFDFSWLLKPGEAFQTPEAVMVYSSEGIGQMSRTYHKLYKNRLCRGKYRDIDRPVLINNWEGTYFDFDEEKILNIAKKAKTAGIELMVLDDGWFGKRNDDTTSLGDWFVNRDKLPNGIEGLADKIEGLGMKFGLWFEPEMISPISKLYDEHPDWCLHVEGRKRSQSRNQLVLDLSRKDVCEYITEVVVDYLQKAKISYVKWDMNRHISEAGSAMLSPERQGEVMHRYMLGLYGVLEELTIRFPDVLFEGCSGGGGRFDPGMLYYYPQIWTSDCTDAVERLHIQYGTSIVYPFSTMGAHVSAVPNHQTGRTCSLKMRGDVAMVGQFGYELDITTMTDDEISEVKQQIEQHKKLQKVFHDGDLYRIASPFDSQYTVWEFVSDDKETAVLCMYRILTNAALKNKMFKLHGLDADAVYEIEGTDVRFSGDVLQNIGLNTGKYFNEKSDFTSKIMVLKKVR